MRYPIIHQHDATDCGPAVLAMIAAHHHCRISIARLRELAGTDRKGTTLAGLTTAAERVGFDPTAVRATHEALDSVTLPAVAHFQNHFVVLYKATRRRIIIGDPAKGLRKLSRGEFLKHWTGVLLLLKPGARLREFARSKSSVERLCSLLLPHYHLFLDALLAAVVMTILSLTSSFFIQGLVDFVFIQGQTPSLKWLALGMLLVTLARAGFQGLRSYLFAHLSLRIDAETVPGYHRHLLGLPLSFFSSRRAGEIISRLNDAIKIRIAISATTLSIVVDAILIVTTASIMMLLDWPLTLRALWFIPAFACGVWLLNKPMKRHQHAAMEKGARLEAEIVETIGAIREIKTFRAGPRLQMKMDARFGQMQDDIFQAQRWAGHATTISSIMAGLSATALFWFGGSEVIAGRTTIGQLMAFYSMLGTILGPIERLANANHSIQDGIIATERLSDILELEPESTRERESAIDRPIDGRIEFEDVSFQYGSRLPVFNSVNLRIEAGECIGIVGESGSGKTTLVSLITRLFDPASGRVMIDGIDVRDYTFDCLRREIAYVPQETVLLDGNIAENIRLGRPDASIASIREAAEDTGVHEFVSRLPDGYDTRVGERGLALSAGQRQRIALARAILVNPSILVLDEPADGAVERVIDRRRGVKTTIVISQRLMNVDRVVELCGTP
jgi:ATP-binding cassette subfamily B protein